MPLGFIGHEFGDGLEEEGLDMGEVGGFTDMLGIVCRGRGYLIVLDVDHVRKQKKPGIGRTMAGKVVKLLLERERELLGEMFGLATIKVGSRVRRGSNLGEEMGLQGHFFWYFGLE